MGEFSGEVSSAHIHTSQEEMIHLENELHKYARLAEDRLELLRRVKDWFKANYSYLYMDKEPMDLWDDIDDELEEELGDV